MYSVYLIYYERDAKTYFKKADIRTGILMT